MINFLSALALTSYLASMPAATVDSKDYGQYGKQPWNWQASYDLLEVARSHGIKPTNGHQWCWDDRNLYGFMDNKKNLVLCTANIPTPSILGEVIRHELVHAAQFCRIARGKPALVQPDRQKEFQIYSTYELKWSGQGYPKRQHEVEYEARVMGNTYTESRISSILDKECGQ